MKLRMISPFHHKSVMYVFHLHLLGVDLHFWQHHAIYIWISFRHDSTITCQCNTSSNVIKWVSFIVLLDINKCESILIAFLKHASSCWFIIFYLVDMCGQGNKYSHVTRCCKYKTGSMHYRETSQAQGLLFSNVEYI